MPEGPDYRASVRYQPDEEPPMALTLGAGVQLAVLYIFGMILNPTAVFRAAGAPAAYTTWAVFAAVLICGVATALQAVRAGRIGGGHVLVTSSSGAFIAVSVTAVTDGGPAMLAVLVAVSALVPLLLSSQLALCRRILTPTVLGTMIMLIPVTVMPTIARNLTNVPAESPVLAAPLCAVATVAVIIGMKLKATGMLRSSAQVVGIAAGSVVGGLFGLYDSGGIAAASWAGLPTVEWQGLDLDFGPVFWNLLPAFAIVALVDTMRGVGNSVAVQAVSWRQPRAVDYRAVQGSVAAAGMTSLLAGLAGTLPNKTLATSASVVELTGIAARRVGIAAGAVFIVLAFIPKAIAMILATPAPVVAGYLTVLMTILFVSGMKIVFQDGLDHRKGLIVGVGFWIGLGFQSDMIFPEHVSAFAGGMLRNGITAGSAAAILMTLLVELTNPRRERIEMKFEISALPRIREFLKGFASRCGWDAAMLHRLDAASEETLLALLEEEEEGAEPRHLRLTAQKEEGGAVLEFVTMAGEENLQTQIAQLAEGVEEARVEREVSLRLLRHLASSVHHQQYHQKDIVTVRVKTSATRRRG